MILKSIALIIVAINLANSANVSSAGITLLSLFLAALILISILAEEDY